MFAGDLNYTWTVTTPNFGHYNWECGQWHYFKEGTMFLRERFGVRTISNTRSPNLTHIELGNVRERIESKWNSFKCQRSRTWGSKVIFKEQTRTWVVLKFYDRGLHFNCSVPHVRLSRSLCRDQKMWWINLTFVGRRLLSEISFTIAYKIILTHKMCKF